MALDVLLGESDLRKTKRIMDLILPIKEDKATNSQVEVEIPCLRQTLWRSQLPTCEVLVLTPLTRRLRSQSWVIQH